MAGRVGRLVAALAGATAALVVLAPPAAADPARPTRYLAEVQRVEPAAPGLAAEVVGGDAFLRVEAEPGTEVVVEGYEGEPWLRISPDGTVERNAASSATYLNDERYGRVAMPTSGVGPDEEPRWERVAADGTWAWHDHRVHWMNPEPPRATTDLGDGRRHVQDWVVPVTVDGERVEITGDLVLLPAVVPVDGVVAGLVVAAGLLVLGRRRPVPVASVAALVAATVALGLGVAEWDLQPADAGASVLVLVLPAAALLAGLVAVGSWLRGGAGTATIAALAAVSALSGWALMRIAVLWNPQLPTTVPPVLERIGVAAVLAVCVAGAVLALRQPAVAGSTTPSPRRPPAPEGA